MPEKRKAMLIYGGRDNTYSRKARVIQALGKIDNHLFPAVVWADDFKGKLHIGVDFEAEGLDEELNIYSIVEAMLIIKAAWSLVGENSGVIYNAKNYPEQTMDKGITSYDEIIELMFASHCGFETAMELDLSSIEW